MARSGLKVDEVLQAPGLPEGEVHDRLLAAMAADGDYQAVQVSPDRFHFARTFRPTWAIVTACLTLWIVLIGIVFLFVKTTETCLAVIESDHRGVRVRLQGKISAAALGRLRAALTGEAALGAASSVPQPKQMPGSPTAAVPPVRPVGAPVASTYPAVEHSGQVAAGSAASPLVGSAAPPAPPTPTLQPNPVAPPAAPTPPATPTPSGPFTPTPTAVPNASGSPSVSSGLPRPPSAPTPGPAPMIAQTAGTDWNAGVLIPTPPPEPGRELPARGPSAAPSSPALIADPQTWVAPEEPGAGHNDSQQEHGAQQDLDDDGTRVSSSRAAGALSSPPRPHAIIDDGSVVELGALTLIGRDPAATEDEQALLIPVDDSTRSVSKTHLAIMWQGGRWSVVDRNSTNGVSIVTADDATVSLTPGVPVPVADGCVVCFGDRSLRLATADADAGGGNS